MLVLVIVVLVLGMCCVSTSDVMCCVSTSDVMCCVITSDVLC